MRRDRGGPPANGPADVGFLPKRENTALPAHGRFRVLPYMPGGFVVYDPARALADRLAAGPFPDRAAAGKECERLSIEATARGEPNEPEEH